MKKVRFLTIACVLLLIFTGCAVNEHSGRITIKNNTESDLRNLKIGEQLITPLLSKGASIDYYYYGPINGSLSDKDDHVFREYTTIVTYYSTYTTFSDNGDIELDLNYDNTIILKNTSIEDILRVSKYEHSHE